MTTYLPGLANEQMIHVEERSITMSDIQRWNREGILLEAFTVGTAIVVASVGRVGVQRHDEGDIVLPVRTGGMGPVARSLYEKITSIQEGIEEHKQWSVICE